MRSSFGAAMAALALATSVVAFSPAGATAQRELVADALAQSFTLRAVADMGGAAPLPFFFGSYADANLTAPPAGADGQASWYNLGIAEAAVFTPPGACTPREQERRLGQARKDVTDWVVATAIPTILGPKHKVPVLPLPTLPCTERLPGFSQSRYPPTGTIPSSSSHDLAGGALCGAPGGCTVAGDLAPVTRGVIEGGRFVAAATDKPSQSSDATVVGLHVPGALDVGTARATAMSTIDGDRLITVASWTATDVCVAPGAKMCALAIHSIRQFARVERNAAGAVLSRSSRTVIAGVQGSGPAAEVTTEDLGPRARPIDLGGHLFIRAVSATGGCGKASEGVADTGGLEIFGHGSDSSPLPPTGLPILGSATGGGVMLGGACAAGRLKEVTFDVPGAPGPGTILVPGRTILVPPVPGGPAVPPGVTAPVLSEPRVITKESVRYVIRSALAWRTAPYWASVLGALLLAGGLGYAFRSTRPVAPLASAIDRFARQFIRG